jgi:hypothetical protein
LHGFLKFVCIFKTKLWIFHVDLQNVFSEGVGKGWVVINLQFLMKIIYLLLILILKYDRWRLSFFNVTFIYWLRSVHGGKGFVHISRTPLAIAFFASLHFVHGHFFGVLPISRSHSSFRRNQLII